MNIVLLEERDFMEIGVAALFGRRAEHLLEVLRVSVGNQVKVGLLNEGVGAATVKSIDNNTILLETDDLKGSPPAPSNSTLVIAMQRPKTMRKILQSAAAFGVKRFIIIETWKVEKSYWTSPLLKLEALRGELILGLEQAGDTLLPDVSLRRKFKPFVEDDLPKLLRTARGIVAHPGVDTPCPRHPRGELVMAIGPEGGFTDYEVAKLADAGMEPVHLGQRPLRSEFAVTVLLALTTLV